jgi:soluble lytic murein transglycosylase-like protein
MGGVGMGGMADVTARISAIQNRLGALSVGTQRQGPLAGESPASTGSASSANAATVPSTGLVGGRPATFGAAATGRVPAGTGGGFALASMSSDSPLAARLPAQAQPFVGAIEQAAQAAGIDPSLLAAVVRNESNFSQGVVSHAGAIGLAQLMPGTAAGLGVDPHDPQQNLQGGARYLRTQLDRFGSVELALAAYNAGPNRVAQAGGVPRIPETLAYVEKVMSTWEQYR